MKKEEQLSDFKQVMRISGKAVVVYPEENVKESFKRLKEEMKEITKLNKITYFDEIINDTIDKITGELGGNGK